MNKPLTQIQTICQHGIALAEKATPGPKHVDQSGQGDERFWLIADVMRDRYGNNAISGEDEPTIQFIAQAFTLLPALATALQEAVAALGIDNQTVLMLSCGKGQRTSRPMLCSRSAGPYRPNRSQLNRSTDAMNSDEAKPGEGKKVI